MNLPRSIYGKSSIYLSSDKNNHLRRHEAASSSKRRLHSSRRPLFQQAGERLSTKGKVNPRERQVTGKASSSKLGSVSARTVWPTLPNLDDLMFVNSCVMLDRPRNAILLVTMSLSPLSQSKFLQCVTTRGKSTKQIQVMCGSFVSNLSDSMSFMQELPREFSNCPASYTC